tara:strand:- start:6414 stop:6692 length:279 start_codon:yes stop_codon:yes gene_type:complete
VCGSLNYGNTGCKSRGGAQVTFSIVGCSGRALGWANDFCGAVIERDSFDYVSGVGISEASLAYDRVLVPETVVNGITTPEVRCVGSIDCLNK